MKPYDVIVEAHDIQGLMTAFYLVSRRRRVAVVAPIKMREKETYTLSCGVMGGLKEESLFQLYWRSVQTDTKLTFEGVRLQPMMVVDAQGIRREVPRSLDHLRRYFVRYYARHHQEIKHFFRLVTTWYDEFMMWESERQKGRESVISQVEIETFDCSLDTFLSRYFKDETLKNAFNLFAIHQALPMNHIDAWSYMLTFFNQVVEPSYQLSHDWPGTFEAWVEKLRVLGADVYEEEAEVWREESDYTMSVQLASNQNLRGRWAVSVAKAQEEALMVYTYDLRLADSYDTPSLGQEWRLLGGGDVSWLRLLRLDASSNDSAPLIRIQTTSNQEKEALFQYLNRYFKDFSNAVVEVVNHRVQPIYPATFKNEKTLEALAKTRQFEAYFVSTHHVSLPRSVYAQAGLFGRMRGGVKLGEVVHEGLFKKATHLQGRPETELVARLLFDYIPDIYPYGHRLKLDFGKTELMVVCEDEAKFYVGSKEPHETLKLDFDALVDLVETATTKEEALRYLDAQNEADAGMFLEAFRLVSKDDLKPYEPYNKSWGMALLITFMMLLGLHNLSLIWVDHVAWSLSFLAISVVLGAGAKIALKWSAKLPIWVSVFMGFRVLLGALGVPYLSHIEFLLMALLLSVYALKGRTLCWSALVKDHPPYEASRQFFISYARGLSWLWSLAWLLMYVITQWVPWPNILLAWYVLIVMSVITIRYEALYLASRTREMRR